MKNLKFIITQLIEDESGQGIAEYVLLLVVVIGIAMLFRHQIENIVRSKIDDVSSNMSSFNVNSGGN